MRDDRAGVCGQRGQRALGVGGWIDRSQVVQRVHRVEGDEEERAERDRGIRAARRESGRTVPFEAHERCGRAYEQPGNPDCGVVRSHSPGNCVAREQHDAEARERQEAPTRTQRQERERNERFQQIREAAEGCELHDKPRMEDERDEQRRRALREQVIVEARRLPCADVRDDDTEVHRKGGGIDERESETRSRKRARGLRCAEQQPRTVLGGAMDPADGGERESHDDEDETGLFADQRRDKSQDSERPPRASLGGPKEPERDDRIERDLVKLGERNRGQRRIDQREQRDAKGSALADVDARHAVERERAGGDQSDLSKLNREWRAGERDQRIEHREQRSPMKTEVRPLFGTVAEAAERVRDDLREGPRIRPVAPDVPAPECERAEDRHVDERGDPKFSHTALLRARFRQLPPKPARPPASS